MATNPYPFKGLEELRKRPGPAPEDVYLAHRFAEPSEAELKRKGGGGGIGKVAGRAGLRLIDYLTRPSMAVAGGVFEEKASPRGRGIGKLDFGAFLKGFNRGFSGKSRHTFRDVAVQRGLRGKPATALGFAGDVLLDPLNLPGLKVVKAAHASEAAATAGRAANVAYKSQAAKELGRKAVLELKAKGPVDKATAKTIRKETRQRFALHAAEDTRNQVLQEGAGKVQFRIAGIPVAESKKLYSGVSKALGPVRRTRPIQVLNRGFRTAATFPGRSNFLKNLYEGAGVAEYEAAMKEFRDSIGKLSKPEAARITHSIENGVDLTGQIGKYGTDLGDVQTKVRAIFDDIYDIEKHEIGLHKTPKKKPGTAAIEEAEQMKLDLGDEVAEILDLKTVADDPSKISNYVYHTYKGKPPVKNKIKLKAVGSEKPGFVLERAFKTLDEAKAAGFTPEEDIRTIVAKRAGKHFQTKARYRFVKQMEEEFGTRGINRDLAKKLNLKPIQDVSDFGSPKVYLPVELAETLRATEEIFLSDELASALSKTLDKGLSWWKFGKTVVSPGHHAKNVVGDVYMSFLAGMKNPKRYETSARIVFHSLPTPKTVQVGRARLTGDEVHRYFEKYGANSGFYREELGGGRFGNPLAEAVRSASEARENFTRMALFIDSFDKAARKLKVSKADPNYLIKLNKAAEEASQLTNKYLVNYRNLTQFERKYMRRAIPFYTWITRVTPTILENIFLHPGRIAVAPKAMRAIQQLTGVDPDEIYEVENELPDWLRDEDYRRVRGGSDPAYVQSPIPPDEVLNTLFKLGKNPIKEVAERSNPIAKAFYELAQGQELGNKVPIGPGMEKADYLVKQLPRPAQEVYGELADRPYSSSGWFNYLTGAGRVEFEKSEETGKYRTKKENRPLTKREIEARKPGAARRRQRYPSRYQKEK